MGIMPFEPDPFIPAALPQCPVWCAGRHGEPDAGASADGLHHFGDGFETWLDDVRNAVGSHLLRRGGHNVDLHLAQLDQWSGRRGLPLIMFCADLIRMEEFDGDIAREQVEVPLTTGEARSVARALTVLADRAEGLS